MLDASAYWRAFTGLALCTLATVSSAQAVVTYELRDIVSVRTDPGQSSDARPFSFTVSDAAVARGGTGVIENYFSLRDAFPVSGPPGDVADLIGSNLLTQGTAPGPLTYERYILSASFAPDRSITDFAFGYYSEFTGYDLALRSVDGSLIRGGYASEGSSCSSAFSLNGSCTLTARLQIVGEPSVAVPEPTSMALLGFGLLGLAAVRRRRL